MMYLMIYFIFKELGNLLPESKIDIHMFGRHLHPQVKEKTWSFGSVVVSVHNELYHKNVCAPQAQTPHLVIGKHAIMCKIDNKKKY